MASSSHQIWRSSNSITLFQKSFFTKTHWFEVLGLIFLKLIVAHRHGQYSWPWAWCCFGSWSGGGWSWKTISKDTKYPPLIQPFGVAFYNTVLLASGPWARSSLLAHRKIRWIFIFASFSRNLTISLWFWHAKFHCFCLYLRWIFSVFAELFVLILKLLRFGQPISQRFQIITNPFRKNRNRKTDDFGVFDEFLALKSDLEDQGSRNLFV